MREVRRNALLAVLAVALGAAASALATSSATTTINIAYSDGYGNPNSTLYLTNATASSTTTLFTPDSSSAGVQNLAISPNNQSVLVLIEDTDELGLVPIGGGTPTAVSGTDGATTGDFSPDGTTILFATFDGIFTIPIAGGTPQQIITPPDGTTDTLPRYSPSGQQIAFASNNFDDNGNEVATLELAPAGGGSVTDVATGLLTDPVSGQISFSPNGKTLAYSGDFNNPGIFTVPVTGGTPAQLTHDTDTWPVYSPDGTKIFFSRDATSAGADDLAPTPVSSSSNDVEELWSVGSTGAGAAVIKQGDYENLAIGGTKSSSTTSTSSSGTTTTTTTSTTTTTGTTTTSKPPASPKPGSARTISLTISGHHYTVRWTGTATQWKITLQVGKKKTSVTVKGSVHSHRFTVTAKGAVSVTVAAA